MTTTNFNTEEVSKSSEESMNPETKKVKIKDKSIVKRKIVVSRLKRRILKHVWLVRAGIILGSLTGLVLVFGMILFFLRKTPLNIYITLASDFIFTPEEKIEQIEGKTNIIILGKGGQNHNAPDLTDTIMFVSVDYVTPSFTILSLPRDIWIPALRAKLNSIYYWGNQKEEGGGLPLSKSVVEEIVGEPVEYGVVIDFEGFKEIIDVMEGVEVDVESAFTDEWFPIEGKENDECNGDPEYKCRYETLRFTQGKQLMDGETALKYARSRNAEGDEGTDLAREKRQQRLISAIKDKALSSEIILSFKTLLKLKEVALTNIETDIDASAFIILVRNALNGRDNIKSYVLPEKLLENPPKSSRYDNLYVFIPEGDDPTTPEHDWSKVHEWVECILEDDKCDNY